MIKLPKYKGRIGVFGLGKTGLSVVRALIAAGNHVTAWDDNIAQQKHAQALGADIKNFTNDLDGIAAVILSPGIALTHPAPHAVVVSAQAAGVPIESDMDLLADALKDKAASVVAITGTNGKSTTTALTTHILRESGYEAQMGGNIGVPALDLTLDEDAKTIFVLELSSYQIDLLQRLDVTVAALTNISSDHLDRHGSMERYISAKLRLFDFVTEDGLVLVGVDGAVERGLLANMKMPVKSIATCEEAADIKLIDGCLVVDHEVFDLTNLPALAGRHNAQNAGIAIGVALYFGASADRIRHALTTFPGLEHRMQIIGQKDHVLFVNDSKATNAEATGHALRAYKNIYWIAGGRPKTSGLAGLEQDLNEVKKAYLIGEAQDAFSDFLSSLGVECEICHTLENAVKAAHQDAIMHSQSVTLLLSPACASFDQYANFEARGHAFAECAHQIIGGGAL